MKVSRWGMWLVCLLLVLPLFSTGFLYPQQAGGVITFTGDEWLSGWQYRKSHEIQGSTASAVTNYQIRITVHYGSGTDSGEHVYLNGKCRSDFGDIRFTKSDGVTVLDYWLEEYTSGDKATFWVEVPSIPASPDTTTIYIYYGNPTATTTSNGKATFLFFDDFDGGRLDWSVESFNINVGGYFPEYGKATLATDYYTSPPRSAKLSTYASCGQSPYDGAGVRIKKTTTLLNQMYRYYFKFRIYLSFRFSTTGHQYVRFRSDGDIVFQYDLSRKGKGTATKEWGTATGTWTPNTNAVIALETRSGDCCSGNAWFDNFFIAKYVDPEPSHGAWGSEETPNSPPNPPSLNSPTTSARFNPGFSVTFTWTFNDPDAGDSQSAYRFQLDDDSDFGSPIIDTGKVTSSTTSTTQTLPSTVGLYYWRVRVWDENDMVSDWSEARPIIVDRIKTASIGVPEITDGLVLYLPFEEGKDSTAFDLSGNNNNGMIYGAGWVDGKYGKALNFDGNSYVNTTDINDIELHDVTFSFWIKVNDLTRDLDIITKGAHTTNKPLIIWRDEVVGTPADLGAGNTDTISVLIYDGSVQHWVAAPSGTLNDTKWHHFTIVIDPTKNLIKIYKDGVQVASNTKTWNGIQPTTTPVKIGDATPSQYPFNGIIDEVRIYNRALTPEEIQRLYRIGNTRLNIGESANIAVKLIYEYDNAPITSGSFTLNGLSLTHQGGGVWTATDSRSSVQAATYNVISGTEGVYGLATVNMNGKSVTVIWDRVQVTLTVADSRIECCSSMSWSFTATYEYDGSDATGYVTVILNDTTTKNSVGKWSFTVESVTESQYGLTAFTSNTIECIWDRIKIIAGGVVNFTIDVDVGGKIWYYAVYEYDNSTFDDSCGVLYVNGFEMTWTGEKWIYAFPYSTEGNQITFHITGVLDNQYGLTMINNQAGDIIINWATATIEIKK